VHSRARDRGIVAVALLVFLQGARAARRPGVTHAELRYFQLVNGLPRWAFVPVWVVMQLGSLGGALGTGAATGAVGGRALGGRVAATGSLTWLAVKAVKPFVRRDRPALAFDATRVLGRAQGGLGYPSGHAAVATAMAAVAAPHLPRRWRPLAWAAALVVGPARMYVGAHLPLDVLGGAALGLAVGTAGRLAEGSAATDRG
jgi:undecaprenyl-diphosphatase